MNTKKFLAVLLITAMLSVMLLSCSKNAENKKSDSDGGDVSSIEEVNATTEGEIDFPHEHMDFGGETFTILIDRENGNLLDMTDFDVEEGEEDVLNDALYRRLTIVEDTYNINFATKHSDDINADISKTIRAGLDEYQAMAPRLMNATKFSANGYGINLMTLENLTLSAPWWDQNCVRDMSFGNRLYLITGDIFYKHYDAIAMIGFNKNMVEDLGLENPYTLVKENKWTLDKFNEMARQATFDLDGDGKMTRNDRYGLSTQADYLTSMINGSGESYFKKDGDDIPYFNADSLKTIPVIIDKVLEHYIGDSFCFHRDGTADLAQFWIFPEGRSLFYWMMPRYIDMGLRAMDANYGFLPIPKASPEQTRYYDNVNHWHGYSYMIPNTVADPESSAYIMEALAYEGRKIVKPAYYDVCLQRKYTRDEESSEMLDIIFSSTVYDFGFLYGVASFVNTLEAEMYQKNQISYVSTYEKYSGKIDKALDDLIYKYNDLN